MPKEIAMEEQEEHENNTRTECNDNNAHPPPEKAENETQQLPRWWKFEHNRTAQGLAILGIGRTALIIANIMLSAAIVYLASDQAGCVEEDEILDECDQKVYGFSPAALVANMAVVSGLLSAFFMPVAGAIIDFTSYRKWVGLVSAAGMIAIQAAQIYTVADTWFAMAVLQSLQGFLFNVQYLTTNAYAPELAREVGESTMTTFVSRIGGLSFLSQLLFAVLVVAVSFPFDLSSVQTSWLAQGICVLWTGLAFVWGWVLLPRAPASHVQPENASLLTLGFVQIYHTICKINKRYRKGLRWYLLALCFAEAGTTAFTTMSVIFFTDELGLSSSEIGIVFLLTLLCALPGTKLGSMVTERTDPKRSWRLSLICLMAVTILCGLAVSLVATEIVYVWGSLVGFLFGWYYPTQSLFFSLIVPKGQEAELSGFFLYCTQILVWLPPLLFTLLVENDVSQTYAMLLLSAFFGIGIVLLSQSAPWVDIVAESAVLQDE